MSPRTSIVKRVFHYSLLLLAVIFMIAGGYRLHQATLGGDSLALAMVDSGAGKRIFYGLLIFAIYLELAHRVVRGFIARMTRDTWINTALMGVSVIIGLVVMELALRPFGVVFSAATQVVEATIPDVGKRNAWATVHKDIGFVPNHARGKYGEAESKQPYDKEPGVTRVMFIGDSIAELRYLERSVETRVADKGKYQFWNTGVSAYSTVQERMYFEQYGRGLKPDVVILEFCLNDFDGTPVVFKDENDGFVVLLPQMGKDEYNQWLFLNSTIYRFYLTLKKWLFIDPRGRPGRIADMKENMARFQAMAREDGFRFKVVVYPKMEPRSDWTDNDNLHYQSILTILRDLGIEHYDLTPAFEEALAKNSLKWVRFSERDNIHPSKAFLEGVTGPLLERGLLK